MGTAHADPDWHVILQVRLQAEITHVLDSTQSLRGNVRQ
jgi:hypothetical protein